MVSPQSLISGVREYEKDVDEALLKKAYLFALDHHGTQTRESGDPFFSHPLEVAAILIDLKMDQKTIIAGILHDTVEDTSATIDEIEKGFGSEIANIVNGVTKLSKFETSTIAEKQTENFKKLLLSAASDIRVLVIKLADRLHNMRTLRYKKKKSKRLHTAKETLEIYASLAERIGMSNMKDELQDLAFQELYPDIYNSIKARLKHLYESSEQIVTTITSILQGLSHDLAIPCSISGRLKTPYSIWSKMNVRNISFEQLSDIMAFRIIVDSVQQCYQMLGAIHRKYLVVPGRFRDYISTPKNNSYQSLHTSVIGPLNKRIEIQIRTREMHLISEYGIAAHWNYKQLPSGHEDTSKNYKNYQWLKNLVEILEHTSGMEEFLENSKTEMFVDQVFCITPKGTLVSLPKGASALDFAYAIHSEIGNHSVGAKINGKPVPLKTIVENGDQVEITTDTNHMPKHSWENYVITIKAKSSIKKALNSMEKERVELIGKSNFEEFFKRHSITATDNDILKITSALKFTHPSNLFYSIGSGSTTIRESLSVYHSLKRKDSPIFSEEDYEPDTKSCDTLPISGIPDVPILPVTCCTPVPGDKIIGLLFKGAGIEIHIEECRILKDQEASSCAQAVELSWLKSAFNGKIKYLAKLTIIIIYAPGNLAKISDIIEKKDANIVNLKIGERFENFVQLQIEVEVSDIAQLTMVISAIRSADFVNNVSRA